MALDIDSHYQAIEITSKVCNGTDKLLFFFKGLKVAGDTLGSLLCIYLMSMHEAQRFARYS